MAFCWGARQATATARSLLVLGIILSSQFVAQPSAKAQVAPPPTPQYTVTELAPLTGDSSTSVHGINASGVAVGESSGIAPNGTGTSHAVTWRAGVPTALGVLPGAGVQRASAINASGQVAGDAELGNPPSVLRHAVRWDGGLPVDLGATSPFSDRVSFATAINAVGQVVGDTTADSGVLWSGGQTFVLGKLPDLAPGVVQNFGRGDGINDVGQIAGTVLFAGQFPRAVQWSAATPAAQPVPLGPLAANDNTTAVAINSSGVVIGRNATPSGNVVPVVWRNGVPAVLPPLPGTLLNDIRVVAAINDVEQIVGTSQGHAVVWQSGTVVDLNTLIPPNSGWDLQDATGINAAGQIVGNGLHTGRGNVGFLLTPTTTVPDVRYTLFLGGINSHSPTRTDSLPVTQDFAAIRRKLTSSASVSHFVYFSYSAARNDQLSTFYCNGWGRDACAGLNGISGIGDLTDLSADPVYTTRDTHKPIDQQVDVLEWLLGQIVARDKNAQIDLIGFSLGGIVASRWAATRSEQSSNRSYVHSIVLVESPVGGIPMAGPVLNCRLDPFLNRPACLLWGLVLRGLFGEPVLRALQLPEDANGSVVGSLRRAPRLFDVTSIQAKNDYVVNKLTIPVCDPTCLLWKADALVGAGTQLWLDRYTPHLDEDLGGQLATSPLRLINPVRQRILSNHYAPLQDAKTAQWVTEAVLAAKTH